MRTGRTFRQAALLALLGTWVPMAGAQAAPDAPAPCTEVEVNGVRTTSFACLTDKLRPNTARERGDPASQPALPSEAIVQRAPNQLGLFNRAATSTRMGNNFGVSVYPQRPPVQAPGSPVPPRGLP